MSLGNLPSTGLIDGATVVTYTIKSEGTVVSDALLVQSVFVDREVNRIPTAIIVLVDGDVANQTFAVSESGTFDPGKKIDIELGYKANDVSVFSGEVVSQQLKIRENNSLLIVTCKDAAYRMTLNRRSRYFSDQSDADAWEQLINEAGLTADVSGGSTVVPELTQHLATDWDYLISRVEALGLSCLLKDGKVTINEPEVAGLAAFKFTYGENLYSLDTELDARCQLTEINSHSWRAADQEAVSESNPPSVGLPGGDYGTSALADAHGVNPRDQHHGGGMETTELAEWSSATVRFSALTRVRGLVEVQGTAELSVGDTIELAGLGKAFNGNHYVSGLRHDVSAGNWTTSVQIGFAKERFTERVAVSAPPAAGLLPAVSGLHIGTIVQLDEDPMGEERIQITLPATAPEGAGNWARLATGLAGSGFGLTFRPDVGAEVVVGFLHDDPRYPVILGGLHSSANPSEEEMLPKEENALFGYVGKNGNKLTFDEDKKTISLLTPGERKIVLDDDAGSISLEDRDGNKIVMDSSGISIESASDLTLKATGNVNIEGTMVDAKASASGAFEAGADLTLKGSLVQIN